MHDQRRGLLQPHKGPSETACARKVPRGEGALQPHKGPSETPETGHNGDNQPCFNPTRVRLKPSTIQ